MIWKSANSVYSRIALYLLFAIVAFYFNYFIDRSDALSVLLCYGSLFGLYLWLITQYNETVDYSKEIIRAGLLFRGLLLFNLPVLSDDYFRFIWDGALQVNGVNPFRFTPIDAIPQLQLTENVEWLKTNIYENLNSKNYYSIYPPICQLIFYFVNSIAPHNLFFQVFLLKGIILLFEIITLFSMHKILCLLKVNSNQIVWYALNPLVIVELTGSIHMEAIMIGFLCVSIYLLLSQQYIIAAILLGLSISVKLWPLMFLPLLFKIYGFKKSIIISTTAITVFILTAIPYFNGQFILNYSSSFQLYFQKFEFNASIYYFLKWAIGNRNQWLQVMQMILPLLVFVFIMYLSVSKLKFNYIELCLFAFTLFLLFTSTVHPWYLTPALALSTLTKYRFAALWSFLICATYITYTSEFYKENYFIIIVEYLIVLSILLYEVIRSRMLQK